MSLVAMKCVCDRLRCGDDDEEAAPTKKEGKQPPTLPTAVRARARAAPRRAARSARPSTSAPTSNPRGCPLSAVDRHDE